MRYGSWVGMAVALVWLCARASGLPPDRSEAARKPEPFTASALEEIPLGLDPTRAIPADNPLTWARVALGRRLFFDPILSGDGTISCATCHDPAHGFSSQLDVSRGINGRRGKRNVPTLWNRAYGRAFFWDGRELSLEDQALHPIESPTEMGSSVAAAMQRLRSREDYCRLFAEAFADGVTSRNLARALASYERVLLLGDSPVDRFRDGEMTALNEAERHGLWLYESRAGCWRCHSGANFTDEGFHNTGVGWQRSPRDAGRYEITKDRADLGRFKTPTLRGLAFTAPFMHDGSLKTLDEVVAFYNRGGERNPNLDPAIRPLDLSPGDAADLIAFLLALSKSGAERTVAH